MVIPATAIQYCTRYLANIIRQKNEIGNYTHTHIYIENKEVLFIPFSGGLNNTATIVLGI